MTLLKRLQEESKEELRQYFDKHLKAKKETMKNLDRELLVDYFAKQTVNTVTAVLDEVEMEVEFRQKGWIGAEEDGSDRDPRYDELETVLDIIKSKRTEV